MDIQYLNFELWKGGGGKTLLSDFLMQGEVIHILQHFLCVCSSIICVRKYVFVLFRKLAIFKCSVFTYICNMCVKTYCMSSKSWPYLYSKLLYRLGQDSLEIQ